ncbi:hypothetical protein MMZ74_31225 (plasmid) [Pseudomonas aeruginosa]|uniref:hypothetical protein n=2 Tax=Pseudomonas aeruginosa TaxID=287 RepID=UPI000B246EB0|nr:hypothetical protein [Pseudomonas aeruginosa]UTP65368.1 hypothetical protein MMZ74_31225 [Pseudomonas aeruginosa]HEA6045651.1 hypothetical protein [Pseudomonas aeruginosa]
MSKELNKAPVEQAGGDERAVDGKPRATKCPDCGEGDLMPGDLCACGYETDSAAGYACSECDGSGDGYVGEVCRECDGSGWFVTPEQARAALAQPSPVPELDFSRPLETENGEPVKWICADVIEYKSARVCVAKDTGLVYSSPYIGLKIRNVMPEQAEAERPEVVAVVRAQGFGRVCEADANTLYQHCSDGDELMTVAQHERIVKAWIERWKAYIELSAKIAAQRDAALAEVERLRESKGDPSGSFDRCMKMMYERDENAKRLDAALARVAELEKQEPVAYVLFRDGEVYYETDDNIVISNTPGDETDLYRWLPVFTAPAAQAQQLHDLDKQCRDDVARALGLRPSQERGFAWSYLLASIKSCVKASEDAAQAQHSVPEGWRIERSAERIVVMNMKNGAGYAAARDGESGIAESVLYLLAADLLAAAPGKEGL